MAGSITPTSLAGGMSESLSSHLGSARPSSITSLGSFSSTDGDHGSDPIAVVGFSLKFPEDGDTTEGFWKMLMEARCASSDFPQDRIDISQLYHKDTKREDSVSLAPRIVLQDTDRQCSYLCVGVTSSRKTLGSLTRLSFPYRRPRPRAWIRSIGCSSKRHTGHWRMVISIQIQGRPSD